ncbi:MAG: KEOPS complex kinase/ATPase Bud32 [Candidatus Woesearchaeota archaeon]
MSRIGRGAEAIIEKNEKNVVKTRVLKSYRHKEIDDNLRKSRTRREAKVLEKASSLGFKVPSLKKMDDKQMTVEMEFLEGPKLRDVLDESPEKYSQEIGKKLALFHNHDIIHGDLTTSNMILHDNEIHFIDFGLSFFSTKLEDKAVDLHLLERTLESKHHLIFEQCMQAVLQGYGEHSNKAKEIIKRFQIVRARGRNKESC